jgi:uncharacterized protein YsxB (DUF464 family)
VEVSGHANSGEVGHDLVCAAASVLLTTLAFFARNTLEAKQSERVFLKLNSGDGEVECEAKTPYKPSIALVFDAICGGFEILARDYPDNISYEIRGKI